MPTKTQPSTLIILLAALIGVPQLGCISGGLKKPTLPSLPSLAFWKKDGESELPPPPARHFDPSRFDVDEGMQTQVAIDGQSRDEFDEYGLKKGSLAAASATKKPIRKPYGLQDLASRADESKSSFGIDADRIKGKFEQAKSNAQSKLSNAQQDFQTAMNSTLSPTKSPSDDNSFGGGAFEPKRTIATASPDAKPFELQSPAGDFGAKKVADAIDNVNTTAKNRFADASSQFGDAQNQFAGALSAAKDRVTNNNNVLKNSFLNNGLPAAGDINTELYDANGRLRSAAKDLVNKTNDAIESPNSLKTKFEQRLAAAQRRAAELSDGANAPLSSLAATSENTRNAINKPFPKFNEQLSAISKATENLSSNFDIKKTASADMAAGATSKIQQEVQEARRQLELLKAQVAQAKLAASRQQAHLNSQVANSSLKQSANQFAGQAAQKINNTVEGVVLPIQNSITQFQGNVKSSVAQNSLTSNQSNELPTGKNEFALPPTLRPRSPNTMPATGQSPTPNNQSDSYYPATPYGGFGFNGQPSNGSPSTGNSIGQVGFQANASQSNGVAQAKALMPLESTKGQSEEIYRASRIDNSVSGVAIPAAILTGNSSFAPGSVNPLRK